jgi:tRNA G18 (ribose-2'-O)-methylase SpoU
MKKLSTIDLGRINVEEFKASRKSPFIVVLDNIRSLNNIGSVFRSSDAFLVESIYLCGITAQPPHKDIHKTALGATESVDWEYFENTSDAIQKLKKQDYKIVSVEQAEGSVFLQDFQINTDEKYALVLGHEVKGVDQKIIDISDYVLEIPQYGTKHSFNISVTTGIILWELFKQYKY